MSQLTEWFTVNKLNSKIYKTFYNISGSRSMDLSALQNVKCCKYLVILIEKDLK